MDILARWGPTVDDVAVPLDHPRKPVWVCEEAFVWKEAERGQLEPELVGYTRTLTVVWVVFFLAMAAVAATLSLAGWTVAWLAFALFGNYALVAALLVGEYLVRRRRFAHLRHAAPAEMWRHACAELRGD